MLLRMSVPSPRRAVHFAFTATLLVAGAAVAAPGIEVQPELGVRLGYALPFGSAENGVNLDRGISGAVPVVIEAGVDLGRAVFVGGLFQYGFAQVKDSTGFCGGNGNSCSGSVVRVGIEGMYHFLPELAFAPWAGLGFGYEWLTTSASSSGLGGLSGSHTYRGIELLTLQGGAEYRTGQWTIGPFLAYSLGRFDTSTGSAQLGSTAGSTGGDISDTAIHSWLMFGVRGAYGL
jgi:hypothetical protein